MKEIDENETINKKQLLSKTSFRISSSKSGRSYPDNKPDSSH